MAKAIINVLGICTDKEAFRIHTKGLGVVCKRFLFGL